MIDDETYWIVQKVLERVRKEPIAVKYEVIAVEVDGRLRLRNQSGLDVGPHPQTNPAYAPAAGTKVWTIPTGGGYLVLSP